MRELRNDQAGFGWIAIIVVAIMGIFGYTALAAINWRMILALFAAGIIAMAVAGAVFFKADWNLVMVCSLIALAIVFITEVSFPVIVGGFIAVFAMWNFKMFSKRIWLGVLLISIGLLTMVLGKIALGMV
jgi:hypothetical protein